ncbi:MULTISPECIES: alpha-amylase [unclassified Streptomyces]|jgi:hypothetical protein|uniref:alpha-amylase n=1 Tax=unclassified Streptomyces TaxID=2593676 RepID=UPI0036D1737F
MTNRMKHRARTTTLAATAAAGLLTVLTSTPPAAAADSAAPACVEYHQSWRYTDVHNTCAETVAVTVDYTNGQWAPCRVVEPGQRATFAGYGTDGNYVTGLRTCDPAAPSGV